jgi:hypothetical protein
MNLRAQIHHAIDDVAPPSPTLDRRVKVYVLTAADDRRSLRSRRTLSFRGTLGFVAVAVALALVAGLFIGGRFWRIQNAPPSTISQPELKSLESQKLHYPTVAPGGACPVTPRTLSGLGMTIGTGPVYLVETDINERGAWGYWVSLEFAYDQQKPGLVLVRARDLESDTQVAFAGYPLAPSKMTAVGSVLGTAHVANHVVRLRSEAVFSDRWWPLSHSAELDVLLGMQRGSSGCIGIQIDGPGFTQNLVIAPAVPGI